jgi:hypothetical protein
MNCPNRKLSVRNGFVLLLTDESETYSFSAATGLEWVRSLDVTPGCSFP